MSRISTHVLDTALGKPAVNILVRLEREENSEWRLLNSARTDNDGRCPQLLPEGERLRAGTYRITFEIAAYQVAKQTAALYPLIQVTFLVHEGETEFHIPLLLSPYGYSTYRGS